MPEPRNTHDYGGTNDVRGIALRIANAYPGPDTPAHVEQILDRMRGEELLALIIPEEFGGRGNSLRDAVHVVFEISKGSASAGLVYAMHLSQLICLVRHARDSSYMRGQLRLLAANQGLIASVTSEVNVDGNIFGSRCGISSEGDGSFLKKSTTNISYANLAEVFLVTVLDKGGKMPVQRLILCSRENSELVRTKENQMMGFKGIVNGAYELRSSFPDEAVFEEPFPIISRATMTPASHLLWSAVWSGIAAKVLEKVRSYIDTALGADERASIEVSIRHSELVNKHHIMNTLIRSALAAWEGQDQSESLFVNGAIYNRLKVVCSEQLNEICLRALPICGFHGYLEDGPYSLSEHIRDALSAPLMVSNHRLNRYTAGIERYITESP